MSLFHNRKVADRLKMVNDEQLESPSRHSPPGKFPRLKTQHSNDRVISIDKWKLHQQYGQSGVHSYRQRAESPGRTRPEITEREAKLKYRTEATESPEVSISRSKEMISLIKNNRKNFLKIRDKSSDYKTIEPTKGQQNVREEPQMHIFSYLDRDFVSSHKKKIDERAISRYASQSTPRKMRAVQENSRKFLMNKMRNDYSQHDKVSQFRKAEMARVMEDEMRMKKKVYLGDYTKRGSSAYFSFLSLSKQQQAGVRQRQAHNPEGV